MPVGLVAQSGEQVVEAVDAGVIKRVDFIFYLSKAFSRFYPRSFSV